MTDMQEIEANNKRINQLALALREFRLAMFAIPVYEGDRDLIAIITDLAEAIEVADQDIKWVRRQHISEVMKRQTTGDNYERFFTTGEDEWLVGDGLPPLGIGQAD